MVGHCNQKHVYKVAFATSLPSTTRRTSYVIIPPERYFSPLQATSIRFTFLVQLLLVLLALYAVNSTAVDLSQCFADVIGCANNTDGQACAALNISNATALSLLRTSKGTSVVTLDDATALSYPACSKYCGTGLGPFSWSTFSQQYAAWFLPYLALLSQLPFGAECRTDNLMSVILTLGSPTLAGYSLYISVLNARWVNDHLFSGIDYPSVAVRQSVVRVLNNLQHVPLRVYPGNSALFESLVVLAENDAWWNTFAAELDYSQTWSIASAISIAWVVIAFLLTVADSFSNVADSFDCGGQGIGSVWLWLLPIVMGWLVLSPKCDYDRVFKAYHKASKHVVVANPTGPATKVTTKFGLTIGPTPDWELHRRNITSPDESRIPPVFSYARTLYWSQSVYVTSLFYRAAWRRSKGGVDDDMPIPKATGHHDHDAIPTESRQGTREQVIQYCKPDSHEYPGVHVLWPRGVLTNMIVASIMSLQLQWGTTLGAVIAVWFSPTTSVNPLFSHSPDSHYSIVTASYSMTARQCHRLTTSSSSTVHYSMY